MQADGAFIIILIMLFVVEGASPSSDARRKQQHAGGGMGEGKCSSGEEASPAPLPLPIPVDSPSGANVGSMWVARTETPRPFWIALPNQEANPGYLSNSARATGLMNPSGSLLADAILGGPEGCSATNAQGLAPLVVDVGAHIGWFSLLAASYGCRVVAFEPQPHAHMFLNASIALNGFQDRIRLVRAAVTDAGPAPSAEGAEAGGGAGSKIAKVRMVNSHGWNWDLTEVARPGDDGSADDGREGFEADVARIDDEVRGEDVLLFKIDAEGEEGAVLRSAERLLREGEVTALLIESKATGNAEENGWKRAWFQGALDRGYSAFEFYEEVGRAVREWDLGRHLFPIHEVASFEGWPGDQVFEDHLFVKSGWRGEWFGALQEPSASIEFPPEGHVYGGGGRVAIATVSRGLPEGYSLALNINAIRAGVAGAATGAVLGKNTRYVVWSVPDLPVGVYESCVVLLDADGGELGTHDVVVFTVDGGGAGRMPEALRWHCERFLGPEACV